MKPFTQKFFILMLLFVIIPVVSSYSQDLEAIKQAGLSESDLKKKAEAAGYNIEDLTKLQQASQQKEAANVSAATQKNVVVTPQQQPKSGSFAVSEFSGREGAEGLQAFGYNVFNYTVSSFEPSLNVPVPTNYIVGPGDEIVISLWGETQLVHNLTVSKNGDIYIPNVGLVSVNGLSMKELKSKIFQILSGVYASLKSGNVDAKTKLDVTTGKLRSVKVYVLGEVNTPGGYTLPAMSTSFTALYYSGGPSISGSLRNIQILRGGKNIASIDLYEYLITGSRSKDVKLEDEDVIYVPPVGKRVAIGGNAFRAAVYELKEGEKFNDLIKYAGGLKFTAYFDRVHVERIIPFAERKGYTNNILSIDLTFKSVGELLDSAYTLENGDVIRILGINTLPENRVTITGFVRKPGVYELTSGGMKIRDLILKADSLQKQAFPDKGILIRTLQSEKKEIYNFSVSMAMKGEPADNLILMNRDEVRIFEKQAFYPSRSISISGEVKSPGTFTRFDNMTLTDLITLAGGITERASTKNIEIDRLDTTKVDVFAERINVELPFEYWKIKPSEDFQLRDNDRVLVKTDPMKNFAKVISVSGEVNFSGSYTILHEGEKVTDFINRAGGFKTSAYLEGIFVKRGNPLLTLVEPLKLADTLKIRYNFHALYDKTKFDNLFSGMIAIDWEKINNDPGSIYNLVLLPGDEIVVPRNPGVVTVFGEVGVPSTVPYKRGAGKSYYLKQAGGYTDNAANGDEVIIQPNGKKWNSSGWFFVPDDEIKAGALIFVPAHVNKSSDAWATIRDIFSITSTAAIVILTAKTLLK